LRHGSVVQSRAEGHPEFELQEETQLKVPAPSPNLEELELPEHVNVVFLQTVEAVDLAEDTQSKD